MTAPSSAEQIRSLVRAALNTAGITQAAAAEQLEISQKHLSQMLTGNVPMNIRWADRLLWLCGHRLVIGVEWLPKTPPDDCGCPKADASNCCCHAPEAGR